MRKFELTFLIKFLLTGTRIFPIAPIIVSSDGAITTSKKLKYFSIGALIPTSGFLFHYYLLTREPGELRSDPYLFLGFARGIISSALPCFASFVLTINCEYLTKTLEILSGLEKKFRLSQKKLQVMFCIVLIEILYLYLGCGIWGFILYSFKMKNVLYRIGISVFNGIIMVTIIASDIFYMNLIILIREYLIFENKELQNMRISTNDLRW